MVVILAETREAARRAAPPRAVLTADGPGRWLAFSTWAEYVAWRREHRSPRRPAPDRGALPLVKLQVWVAPEVRDAVQRLRRPGESGGDVVTRALAALQAGGGEHRATVE